MARLELSLLGGFHASLDGSPVTGFERDKTRALLVYVCMENSGAHTREALARLLWPDIPDGAARSNLRKALFDLRQALGEREDSPGVLLVNAETVQLHSSTDCLVDAIVFGNLIAACRAHSHRKPHHCTTCHARLQQAVELYRGEFLRGFHLDDCQAFEEWLVLKREALHQQALDALARLATYHHSHADYEQALRYAYRQLDLEPWREEAHRQVMLLLALTDRRSVALAQFRSCRRALQEELDAQPSEETIALYERIRAGDLSSAEAQRALAPLAAESAADTQHSALSTQYSVLAKHNLPRSLTPFIGRREELARLSEWLDIDSPDFHLITITGAGGVGKTRFAVQAASRQVGAYDDGVYWVPLASISSPTLLASSIAQAIGFHFESAQEPQAQLLSYLRDKEMLLLLDNFEHLLSGNHATNLILSILKDAPRTTVLITSRERLGLQAEQVIDVSGLPFPAGDDGRWTMDDGSKEPSSIAHRPSSDARSSVLSPQSLMGYEAVQLFVERAQQMRSNFRLDGETAQGVTEVCRLVSGLPLGVVLAAAWVRDFQPTNIADSIKTNLDFLSSTARDASPQHASLRAVFNHSWNLLTDDERAVFRKLSVFRGGWEEEAAEKVSGASAHSLLSLVDKSLLRRDAVGRFDMHEALRQYAAEKLDELPQEQGEVSYLHADYYRELAELAETGMQGEDQGEWLARLEQEHDNLRTALHWAIENGDKGIGLRMGAALWRFWYIRGYYSEGREQLAAVLGAGGAMQSPAPSTQHPIPSTQFDLMRARRVALGGAGVLAFVEGDHDAARALSEESLAISSSLGDKQGMAGSLNTLGILAHQEGDMARARALHQESLAIRREMRDKPGIAISLNNLGVLAQQQSEHDEARVLHEETLALRRELGDKLGIASSLGNLGLVAQGRGDYNEARALYEESLTLRSELGDKGGMAELFSNLGLVAQKLGDYDEARALYEKGLALSRELGYRWSIALALNNLGVVAQARGEYDDAAASHKESLILRRDMGERVGVAGSLAYLGAVAAGSARIGLERSENGPEKHSQELIGQMELERAATLFGTVDRLLENITAVLSGDEWQVYEQNLALVRSLLSEEAFARVWSEGRAMSMEQAIDYALDLEN